MVGAWRRYREPLGMSILSRRSERSPRPQAHKHHNPQPLSELNLAPVDYWAARFLRELGVGAAEVRHLRSTYGTTLTPQNPEHRFDAGDPPNPWTLAVACAEQAVYDALHTYIFARAKFMPAADVKEIYAQGGLEALAGVIRAREKVRRLRFMQEAVNQDIESSFQQVYARMMGTYLQDFWPERKPFCVRIES